MTLRKPNRLPRSLAILLATLGLTAVFAAGAALAAWSASGGGGADALAEVMPRGATPTASVSGSAVALSWPAVTMSDGSGVQGYIVNRYNAVTGQQATVGSGCSGVLTTTSCTELGVPSGSWNYTDTPVQFSWSGAQSDPVRVSVLTRPTPPASTTQTTTTTTGTTTTTTTTTPTDPTTTNPRSTSSNDATDPCPARRSCPGHFAALR